MSVKLIFDFCWMNAAGRAAPELDPGLRRDDVVRRN